MFKYLIILLSLVAGLFIYLVWRDISSPFYHWAANIGLASEVDFVRNHCSDIRMPSWFVYSLPDGLWMFSFVLTMMTVWGFDLNKNSIQWIGISIAIGFSIEVTQMYFSELGRFDWMDMFFISIGALLPIVFFLKKTTYDIHLINQ